jgi:hypothetical protein
MTKEREALLMALEALENIEKIRVYEGLAWIPHSLEDSAITAIKEALAQPSDSAEQEPLEYWNAVEGWVKIDEVRQHFETVSCGTIYKNAGEGRVPVYTAPQKREWVGLTDEWVTSAGAVGRRDLLVARAIEAKLKELNEAT